MKVSIAMATHCGGKYLPLQLESFLEQTRLPDELVITDDCSTDDTLDVVRRFAAKAPFPVRWCINTNRLGYCGTFNHALSKTTGDLVFLSDQDDVWFPHKIERITNIWARNPSVVVVMNDAAITNDALVDTRLTKLGQLRSAGLSEAAFVMGCCAAVSRIFLNLCLPIPDGYPAHDAWLVQIADGLSRRLIIPEVLQYYRRHSMNASQAIVNRTTPVTRLHASIEQWKQRVATVAARLTRSSSFQSVPDESQAMMIRWARDVAPLVPRPYTSEFLRFLSHLEHRQVAHARRAAVRQRRPLSRLVSVSNMWLSGNYAEFSGWKSAIRDLLGPG